MRPSQIGAMRHRQPLTRSAGFIIAEEMEFPRSRRVRGMTKSAEIHLVREKMIGVGKSCPSPPFEPYVRFARIRLSSRWFPHRDCLAKSHAVCMANSPASAKKAAYGFVHQTEPLASFDAVAQRQQQALRPDRRFHPRPIAIVRCCALPSPRGHSRHWSFASLCLSRIHLPASLPSAWLCSPRLSRLAPHRYYEGSDSCLPSPRLAGLSAYSALPSEHPAPNHVMCPTVALSVTSSAIGYSGLHRGTAGSPQHIRRIGFVNLRAARSPPVALHPASQRRSYLQLQSCDKLWRGLPPRQQSVLADARSPRSRG